MMLARWFLAITEMNTVDTQFYRGLAPLVPILEGLYLAPQHHPSSYTSGICTFSMMDSQGQEQVMYKLPDVYHWLAERHPLNPM